MNKYNIIILSNQPFDAVTKTNKHRVANELASRGHTVVFVDPPTRFKFLKSIIKKKKLQFVKKQKQNYYVYYPVNFLNFAPFSLLSNLIHSFVIKKILKKHKNNKSILWAYHFDFPQIFQLKNLLKPNVFIYDVVDSYKDFPEYSWEDITNKGLVSVIQKFDKFFKIKIDQHGKRGKNWVLHRESQLAKKADLIFTSHPNLYKRFKKLHKKTFYMPNAGVYSFFKNPPKKVPNILKQIKSPKVLYAGALDNYKFDVDTFIYLAKNTPNVSYCLVGPLKLSDSSKKVENLKKLKNVVLAGLIPSADIYAHNFDAYIIPYRLNEYVINGCFPIKLFNALSTGTPVVVSDLPCYTDYKKVLYIAKNNKDWVVKVKTAVGDKSVKNKQSRIKIASKNTWKNKVNKQLQAINQLLQS